MKKIALAAGVLAAASLALGAAPASADTITHTDAAHDVQRFDGDTQTTVPAVTEGDVRRVTVAHTSGRLVVKLKYAELSRTRWFGVTLVRTSSGKLFEVDLVASKNLGWQGKLTVAAGNGSEIACSGADRKVDYAVNTVRISVPRSCLGDPRWVKVGVAHVRFVSQSRIFGDDAFSSNVGDNLTFTRRLYRA